MPSENSWGTHKHIFAKLLSSEDIRLIDKFYETCALINNELAEAYSLPHYWREKARITAERLAEFSEQSNSKEEYETSKKRMKFFEDDDYWWQPNDPPRQIVERIKTIQYVTTTPAGERLRKIAKL